MPDTIRDVKRIALTALFADDVLMEKLVLKGGNLLDLVYGISIRGSIDLDLSVDGDFTEGVEELRSRIEVTLNRVFKERGYVVFDVKLRTAPPKLTPDREQFWGGYKLEFKIAEFEVFEKNKENLELLRKLAIPVGDGGSTKMKVDLSKHEYCKNKKSFDVDGYTIFAYAPETFVCEKIRAICQQMKIYVEQMQSNPSPRAKDFVDIYLVMEEYDLELDSDGMRSLISDVFAMKRVPKYLIGQIEEEREFHRDGFESVRDTMKAGYNLQSYDFYFDYVVGKCVCLQALWNE